MIIGYKTDAKQFVDCQAGWTMTLFKLQFIVLILHEFQHR